MSITSSQSSTADESGQLQRKPKQRGESVKGLLLIGLFKLSKAIFFGAVAAGALHLVHRNIGDMVMRLTSALPLAPGGRFAGMLMDRADLIDNHNLRQAGILAFSYAVCCLIEGVGLIMQQVWAEYFTVVLTVVAMPYEIFEIIRRVSAFKITLLALNVAVLVYLLWLLGRKRKKDYLAIARGY